MNVNPSYILKPLGEEDRAAFHCGYPDLDRYFLERASRDAQNKVSAVFVLVPEAEPAKVVGYYTLSSLSIEAQQIPPELGRRLGRYKYIGATLLGRLAVSDEHKGRGLGEFLLMDALRRAFLASRDVASFAVVVDPKDERAARFYAKYGFIPLSGNRMFYPMASVEELARSRSW